MEEKLQLATAWEADSATADLEASSNTPNKYLHTLFTNRIEAYIGSCMVAAVWEYGWRP